MSDVVHEHDRRGPAGHGRMLRKEDRRFVRGRGRYLDDIALPGMLMTARALLDRDPDPSEQTIREAISGQICRCTGYTTIVRSVRWAAEHEDAATSEAVGSTS